MVVLLNNKPCLQKKKKGKIKKPSIFIFFSKELILHVCNKTQKFLPLGSQAFQMIFGLLII